MQKPVTFNISCRLVVLVLLASFLAGGCRNIGGLYDRGPIDGSRTEIAGEGDPLHHDFQRIDQRLAAGVIEAEGREAGIETFPLPAPRPNRTALIREDLWKYERDGEPVVWGDVSDRVSFALVSQGYRVSYFRIGSLYSAADGFAIVTNVVEISDEEAEENIGTSLAQRIFGSPQYYRMFVFILAPGLIEDHDVPLSGEQARAWIGIGADALPDSMFGRLVDDNHRLWCLTYRLDVSPISNIETGLKAVEDDADYLESSGLLNVLDTIRGTDHE